MRTNSRFRVALMLGLLVVLASGLVAFKCSSSTLPALAIRDGVVTWNLNLDQWWIGGFQPGQMGAHLQSQTPADLEAEINRPRGWTRAGITFRYVSDGKAMITFHITNQYRVTGCGRASEYVGCAQPSSRHCDIWLTYPVTARDGGHGWRNQPVGVVNHELGHCFGFEHTKQGLMKAVYDEIATPERDYYPSLSQIEKLRKQVS